MFTMLAALAMAAPVPAPTPDWVTIKGTVVWPEKEKIPERKAFDLTIPKGGDIDYIRTGGTVYDDTFLIDDKTRGLKDVTVWVRPDDDDLKAKFPAEKIHPDLAKAKPVTHTVTSQFCRFDKRVVAARAGDAVEFVNAGTVPIAPQFALGDDNTTQTIPYDGKPMVVKDLKAGTGYFRDMAHQGWKNVALQGFPETGRVRVFDHPYFAVTNELGEFEIKQVPKGKWRFVYLHAGSGFHKGKDGRLGFPVEVEGDKKGLMTMKPLAFEKAK
jgi:hypothetical protein